MKTGSTSLYQYLRRHPQIFMSHRKEPNFFIEELNWQRGRSWYEAQFAGADGSRAVGEASTGYTKYPQFRDVPRRMASLVPDARLVYVVRDPIERMRSHYVHRVASRTETKPVEVALLSERRYLDTSLYAAQIEQYLEHFHRERLLVITSEALRESRLETMRKVYAFLSVSEDLAPDGLQREFYKTVDKRSYKPLAKAVRDTAGVGALTRVVPRPLKRVALRVTTRTLDSSAVRVPDDLRGTLRELLRDDVTRLRAYLPSDFDGWGIA